MFQHAQHITRLLGAPLCAALLLTAGCAEEKTSAPPAAESQQTQTKAAAADDTAAKDKEVKVNVYYPKNDGMGLVADSRTVKLGGEDKYTAALKSLLAGTTEKGQTNVFPKHVKLRSVKVQDGVATVDFSKELQKNFNGGATGEEMLVGSIVNTLTDFPEVKKVRIRIEGEDVETLSGHMDLSEPLPRMTELLK